MVNPKVISENTPYRVRQKIDILSRKLAKDLNIPIDKYGVVFGGKTYTDGAALEIIVTPRLLEAYQVKNNEKKIEEAFVEEAVSEVKKGIPELFESNPELASIGTPQQYSQYLDTIFPDSKVKDIVYHGTDLSKDSINFKTDRGGIFLASSPIYASYFSEQDNAYPALIDFRNIYQAKKLTDDIGKEEIDIIKTKGFDSVIGKGGISKMKQHQNDLEYIAFKPQQIHILGSKQDIQGFKEFISSTQTPLEKIDSKSKLKTEAKFQIKKLGDGQFLYAGDIYPSREDAFRAFEEDNTPSIQEAQIPISQMDRIIDNLPPFTGDMEDLGFEEDACDL